MSQSLGQLQACPSEIPSAQAARGSRRPSLAAKLPGNLYDEKAMLELRLRGRLPRLHPQAVVPAQIGVRLAADEPPRLRQQLVLGHQVEVTGDSRSLVAHHLLEVTSRPNYLNFSSWRQLTP